LIPELVELAKTTLKEKVSRVCLATLRNMLMYASEPNTLPMVGCKVMKLCDQLSTRKWSDEDIKEDINYLQTELAKIIQRLT
jgi:V-type H+-transporting ATPase subunit H